MRAGMYAEDQFCHIPISGGILDPTSASHCIRPLTRPPIHHWGNIMALDAKGRNREASERPVRTMASKTRRTILCDLYCRGTARKSRGVPCVLKLLLCGDLYIDYCIQQRRASKIGSWHVAVAVFYI